MVFQGNKDAFLRSAVNKLIVINVILTELQKSECNALHSYDDADTDITK